MVKNGLVEPNAVCVRARTDVAVDVCKAPLDTTDDPLHNLLTYLRNRIGSVLILSEDKAHDGSILSVTRAGDRFRKSRGPCRFCADHLCLGASPGLWGRRRGDVLCVCRQISTVSQIDVCIG